MDKNHLVEEEGEGKSLNFIEQIIEEELAEGKNGGRVHTRFPPEPNGYLHIGHATSICLNFGLATEYQGKCNLRFDDTNPSKEDVEYIDSIQQDIQWLGFQWEGEPHFASDYFQQLYDWAEKLILEGKAYVDDQPAEVISAQRMTPTEPGVNSPYRDRTPEENLDLFRRMKNGEFQAGEKVLRAKIDMASSNMLMRDPIMYRIIYCSHHRTGDRWCIYPMYDFTHGQSDYLEGITHSICTLEFEIHRPLYNWFLDQLTTTEYRPRQIEFARRNLNYTVMSKRRLLELVQKKYVSGWDDPRMPTICGLRRRGYTPESIRMFAEKVGVARREIVVDMALLEYCVREHLNKTAPRVMAVLDPVKVVIDNYPEGETEYMEIENNPEDVISAGGIVIDKAAHLATVDGKPMELSFKEFELLTYFLENQGIALSREKILNSVWNYDYFGDARTIDTHVKKLRSKMGDKGEYIKTVWGMGYKFEVDE
mgnify:CR=1 FL=1